jgi:hypothetical protein
MSLCIMACAISRARYMAGVIMGCAISSGGNAGAWFA